MPSMAISAVCKTRSTILSWLYERALALDLENIPIRNSTGSFQVVVESPRVSGVKFKYEPALGAIAFDHPLISGLVYPFDCGFVPGTRAADGGPVDVLVLSNQPMFPGVVIAC